MRWLRGNGPRPRTGRRTSPPAASSSAAVPRSTIRPSRARRRGRRPAIVDRRWVATSTVRPATAGRRRSTSSRSVSVSTADSGSSSTSTRAPAMQGAGERDALALAAREVDAALADQRVVAVRQLVHERGDAGRLAGREHLVPGRVRPRRQQVVAQRHREEDGPLRHDRDRAAELGERHVADVDAAEQDAPLGRVVEPRQQVRAGSSCPSRSAPQTATISPGSTSRSTPRSTSCSVAVARSGRPRSARRAARRAAGAACAGSAQRLDPVEPGEAAAGRRRSRAGRG